MKKSIKTTKSKEKVYTTRDYNEAVYLLANGFDIQRIEFKDFTKKDIGTFVFNLIQKGKDVSVEGERYMRQDTLVRVQAFISSVNLLQRKLNRAKEQRDKIPFTPSKKKNSYFE